MFRFLYLDARLDKPMSIQRSSQDQERKLAALKMQLYGKTQPHQNSTSPINQKSKTASFRYTDTLIHSPRSLREASFAGEAGQNTKDISLAETHYLQKDLLKICLLATLIIAIQLSLKLVLKI